MTLPPTNVAHLICRLISVVFPTMLTPSNYILIGVDAVFDFRLDSVGDFFWPYGYPSRKCDVVFVQFQRRLTPFSTDHTHLCRLTACLTTLSIFFADACTPNPCGDNAVCEGSATFAYCYCEPGYENTGSSSWGFAGGNFACTPIGECSLAVTTRLRINNAVLSSPRGHRQPFAATATFAEPTNEARFRSAS